MPRNTRVGTVSGQDFESCRKNSEERRALASAGTLFRLFCVRSFGVNGVPNDFQSGGGEFFPGENYCGSALPVGPDLPDQVAVGVGCGFPVLHKDGVAGDRFNGIA